jgi:hypothetical protein
MAFVPGELKWYQFSLEGGAELKTQAFACADCGLVWTTVAYPENLRALLANLRKTNEWSGCSKILTLLVQWTRR